MACSFPIAEVSEDRIGRRMRNLSLARIETDLMHVKTSVTSAFYTCSCATLISEPILHRGYIQPGSSDFFRRARSFRHRARDGSGRKNY